MDLLMHLYKSTIQVEKTSKFESYSNSLFHNKITRQLVKKGANWTPILDKVILALIFMLCFSIRLFAFIRFEAIIHEFDPYFNYRTTEYLTQHGVHSFWNWFDHESWYPVGRSTGHTLYPGLMLTTYIFYQIFHFFGINLSVKFMCVFVGPVFAGFTSIVAYLLGCELTKSSKTGLLMAFFVGISPSFLSRSIAGSYDNESVAIFALVLSFYGWLRSVNHGTMSSAMISAFCTYYMVLSWGGYVFIINTIAVYVLALIFLDRLTYKEHIAYTVYYILLTTLILSIPIIDFQAIKSSEYMGPHGVLIATHVYTLFKYIQKKNISMTKISRFFGYGLVIMFLFLFVFMSLTGMTNWSERSRKLLDPLHSTRYVPIIASVSEHQSPAWGAYAFDLSFALLLAPTGLMVSLKSSNNALFFLAIYAILSTYFAGVMIRLMLVASPAVCCLAGLGVSYILDNFMTYLRSPSLQSFSKLKPNLKKKMIQNMKVKFSPLLASSLIAFIGYLCIRYALHSTWTASHAYAHPSVVGQYNSNNGKFLQDDFREAYTWFRYNTHPQSRIMCWWDYGYQTTGLANRTVYVDNNTWNFTHIATVGMAFSLDEQNAYQIARKLDVDYVFVVFGGFVGYGSDDINKFLWMVRIAGGDFPSIQEKNYLTTRGQYTTTKEGSETMLNSLMYKLSYFKLHDYTGGVDRIRNYDIGARVDHLTHFEEVFSSESLVVRIYRVLPEPNRSGIYYSNLNGDVESKIMKDDI